MRYDDVVLASLHAVEATHRVRTADLEAQLSAHLPRLGLLPGTLEALSGIVARRFWDADFAPSDAATRAAEGALADAGVDRGRIGVLINTSVCRDYIEPSTACLVHGNLGLPATCLNFDLSNACLGFLNGMDLVAQMIERGQVDYGLVVDGESSRFVVEKTLERLQAPDASPQTFRDNIATLTLGSGGAAAVLTRSALAPDGHRFTGLVSLAASQHNHLCRGQVDWMKTDTTGLLAAGLELATQTWARAADELDWSADALDHAVLHQVSKPHTEHLARALGLDLGRVPVIYPEHGNVGPASVPMTLAKAAAEGRVKRGDRVALMGIGSGLNCAMAEVIW
ncbi:MAG: 3-oxoacyl-ACP synthase III [Sandaracinaceae bacterium]|nr:MAG: 3-oxoacyl-ACP synthase III [Sandaracinaceae bacterium]HBQ14121.1 3-oxoacyl-ACP synthase III [Myxococcales bacterium]